MDVIKNDGGGEVRIIMLRVASKGLTMVHTFFCFFLVSRNITMLIYRKPWNVTENQRCAHLEEFTFNNSRKLYKKNLQPENNEERILSKEGKGSVLCGFNEMILAEDEKKKLFVVETDRL